MTTTNKPLGVYVHIPFCMRKCPYCDFLSFENESALVHKVYVKALMKELEAHGEVYGNDYTVNTLFIGGGTPSLLLPSMVKDIADAVKDNFNMDINSEITIEANPRTLSPAKLSGYLEAGVNRISIGVQSFNDLVLKILGRPHTAEDGYSACRMAREAGFKNINLDLMFGIPGQHGETWMETLMVAVGLSPEHVSFYSLTIEEGTKFHDMFETGPYAKLPDEVEREMHAMAVKELSGAGHQRYEISNAAKPGHECRHNIKYWTFEDFTCVNSTEPNKLHCFKCRRNRKILQV